MSKFNSRFGVVPALGGGWGLFFAAILIFNAPLSAVEVPSADTFLRQGIDDIISVVTKEASSEARFEKVKKIFYESFDLPRLAGMTLGGVHWRSLDMKQKMAFTEKYATFVLTFYLDKLESYDNNKVVVGEPELKSGGKKAIVPTQVEYQGKMAELKYSMVQGSDNWKIYDVEVEGVRLSTTYRNQFGGVLNKDGFEALLAELDRLIAQAKK